MTSRTNRILLAFTVLAACNPAKQPIDPKNFEATIGGKTVGLYYISTDSMRVAITNYGARVVGIWVPDRDGNLGDVNIGYASINGYLNTHEPYYGAIVGRYANRIRKGKFTLNGEIYQLPINNGINHLHGGPRGFSQQVWSVKEHTSNKIVMCYVSKDGEEGYPGTLEVELAISLSGYNALNFDFAATTDKPTVVNLTNHSFFNLAGEGTPIESHFLMIPAWGYTPIDSTLIPIGTIDPVNDTPFDFRTAKRISRNIGDANEQIRYGRGYDHNFVLKNERQKDKYLAAEVYEETSGRVLQVWTQEPGLQFYSGNFMDGSDKGKYGQPLTFRTAFCLETQCFPDSPNNPSFPSTTLIPGQKYATSTTYLFKVRKYKK